MKRFWPLLLLCLFAMSGCSESSDPTRKNDFIPLTSITISSDVPSIPNLTSNQFTADGDFSDAFSRVVTDEVFWESSDTSTLTISNSPGSEGLATAVSPGTVTVSASDQGVTAELAFTVTDATIDTLAISPVNPSVPLGRSQQFTASGAFSDSTVQDLTRDVLWASSDTTVATVSNELGTAGLVATAATGQTTISATFSTTTVNSLLTVAEAAPDSVTITPPDPTIETLGVRQFRALATLSDGTVVDVTEQASWASSNNELAIIASEGEKIGQAIGLAPGTPVISATFEGVSGKTDLAVTGEEVTGLSVTIGFSDLPVNTSSQKTVTITKADGSTFPNADLVTWSSSNPTTATVSNSVFREGIVTGLAAGNTEIKATLGSLESEEEELTVNSAEPDSLEISPLLQSINNLTTLQFTADALNFSDGTSSLTVTDTVTWSVDDSSVAAISNEEPTSGLLTALAPGTVEVTAQFPLGGTASLEATTTLEVDDVELTEVTIDQVDPSMVVGASFQFTAKGVFSNGDDPEITDLVTWTSSDPTIARISNDFGKQGQVEGLREGEVTITATLGDQSDDTELTVNQ